MHRPIAAIAIGAALSCATPRPAPPPAIAEPPPAASQAPAAPPAAGGRAAAPRRTAVSRGMDAAQVRAALGEPARVEKVDSSAAPGARYERWVYADQEVVLLDGKVIDVLP